MKMHLLRPHEHTGAIVTMCGIQIKSFSTADPAKVTCAKCLGSYSVNVDWYWNLLSDSDSRKILEEQ